MGSCLGDEAGKLHRFLLRPSCFKKKSSSAWPVYFATLHPIQSQFYPTTVFGSTPRKKITKALLRNTWLAASILPHIVRFRMG
jgi:hypothetical protein